MLKLQIEKQLTGLERYLDIVEDYMTDQADDAESEDERRELRDYFPNLLRSSLFVTIYSVVENELNTLCKQLAKKDGLKVEDLRGNGIQRANTFLVRVCRVDFPEDSQEWQLLRDYNQIRNLIVHGNGMVTGGHLQAIVERHNVDLKDGIIHLSKDFCLRVLEVVREFFRQLNGAVNKKTGSSR